MTKSSALFTINEEILVLFKEKVKARDRSRTVELLIESYLEKSPEDQDEIKLMREIEKLSDEREKLTIQISTKKTILNRIREEKEKKHSEEAKQAWQDKLKMAETIKHNRGLEEL